MDGLPKHDEWKPLFAEVMINTNMTLASTELNLLFCHETSCKIPLPKPLRIKVEDAHVVWRHVQGTAG